MVKWRLLQMKLLKKLVKKHVKVGLNVDEAKAIAKATPIAASGPVLVSVLASLNVIPETISQDPAIAMYLAGALSWGANSVRKILLRKGIIAEDEQV